MTTVEKSLEEGSRIDDGGEGDDEDSRLVGKDEAPALMVGGEEEEVEQEERKQEERVES